MISYVLKGNSGKKGRCVN